MKTCSKCKSSENGFYADKNAAGGFRTICKVCDKLKASIWNSINKESHANHQKEYREQNRKEVNSQRYKYVQLNKDKINALSAKRRAFKMNATPTWLTADHLEDIKVFYTQAKKLERIDGVRRHIDHIVPLQGETVSGLHVPWNLQILTEEENLKKSNKHV